MGLNRGSLSGPSSGHHRERLIWRENKTKTSRWSLVAGPFGSRWFAND